MSAAIVALGTGVASAADLPMKAPPPVYAPQIFTWTGFYIGGNIGAAWTRSEWQDTLFDLDWGRTNDARFIGGGQIGVNYAFGGGSNFVIGAEADFDWVGNHNGNGVTVVGPLGHGFNVVSNDTWITTFAARIGFAADRALFYGKFGGGWVGNNGFTVTDLTTGGAFTSSSNTASGWLVGAGIEYAFTNNWTVKLEYDYLGLPSRTFVVTGTVIPALAGDTITSNHNVQELKLGVNYLFNFGGPVVARY